jgi:two-component system, chemotaxis family, chemotaxis protein CheY
MGKRILTVDGAAGVRKMISSALAGAGHVAIEAGDGEEALGILRKGMVDLIIAGVDTPRTDGIELTRQLRALPPYSRTPIVLLTAATDPSKKLQGRAAGATGWLVKPFSQEQLLAIVAKVLPS